MAKILHYTELDSHELDSISWVINTPVLEWWMLGCQHPCPHEVMEAKIDSGWDWATFEHAINVLFVNSGYTREGSDDTTATPVDDDGIDYSNAPGYRSIPDIDMW